MKIRAKPLFVPFAFTLKYAIYNRDYMRPKKDAFEIAKVTG
jgi:hypothetical protein